MKQLTVNGVTLAYEEYGSGEKYLLSTQNFFFRDCHMALLGKPPYDYHVFLIYMRGYGQSSHITDPTPKDYNAIWGEDVIAFAEAMRIDRFYYTGISHGNWAGWYIAFHRPELLRGFVCVDGIAQYRELSAGALPRTPGYDPEIDDRIGNYEKLSAIAWMEHWPTRDPKRLARRMANHEEHTQILMGRTKEEFTVPNAGDMTCCGAHSREELLEKASRVPVPVLIWEGGLDPLAKVEDALALAQAIPGASLLTYQHLGHGGADECPEMAARDCDRFFRDTEGRVL